MNTYIYGLKDPITDEIRYVGKSNNPNKRLSRHITNAKSSNKKTHCYCWIKSLLNKQILPELIILEECSIDIWGEREDYWIKTLPNLTNLLDGGKFCPMSIPEIAKKAGISNLGRKSSLYTKQLLSDIRKKEWKEGSRKGGWNHTKEYKEIRKESTTNLWKNRSIEEKIEIGKKISLGKSKKYNQYDLEMNIIKTWDSIKDIEIFYYNKTKGQMKRQITENGYWKGFYWIKDEASDPLVVNENFN